MTWTTKELKALVSFHRQYGNSEWKDCPTCGIAHQADGPQCSDCLMSDAGEQAEEEVLARLEMELDRLREELRQYGHEMSYTAIRIKKSRIGEILTALEQLQSE